MGVASSGTAARREPSRVNFLTAPLAPMTLSSNGEPSWLVLKTLVLPQALVATQMLPSASTSTARASVPSLSSASPGCSA